MPASGLPHTCGALVLAVVFFLGYFLKSSLFLQPYGDQAFSVPAVLSRAWLCSVTGFGQLCVKHSPQVPSWMPAEGATLSG